MIRAILLLTAVLPLVACAQMKTAERADPSAAAQLQAVPAIAKETDQLNHLARISIDANKLYSDSATEADDAALKAELGTLAKDHASFARSLQTRVASLGAKPAETGEPVGSAHLAFANVRGAVQNDSVTAAAEVYRGETYMIDELGKTLDTTLTPESRNMLEAQLTDTRTGRDRVEALKDKIEARLSNEGKREDAAKKAADPG